MFPDPWINCAAVQCPRSPAAAKIFVTCGRVKRGGHQRSSNHFESTLGTSTVSTRTPKPSSLSLSASSVPSIKSIGGAPSRVASLGQTSCGLRKPLMVVMLSKMLLQACLALAREPGGLTARACLCHNRSAGRRILGPRSRTCDHTVVDASRDQTAPVRYG